MSKDPVSEEVSIGGYLSEAGKRRFTITAGIVGTSFLIAQFVLPIATMMGFMAFESEIFDVNFSRRSPDHVAILDDSIWFVETEDSFDDNQESSTLARIDINGDTEPETMADLSGTPFLLAGEDRLWLITKTSIATYQHSRLTTIDQPTSLTEISLPFLFEGMPAVLERWPNELALVVHDGVVWQHRAVLPIVMPDPECGCGLEWAKAMADDRGVHLFLEFGTSLYYGLWIPGLELEPKWESVAETGEGWSPVLWRGEPAVIGKTSRGEGSQLVGTRRGADGWVEFLRHGRYPGDVVSALNHPGSDALIVATGMSYSNSFQVLRIEDDHITREMWIGEQPTANDRFPNFIVAIMATQYGGMIFFPLILAVVLSAMMRRHRVGTYSIDEQTVDQASLTRRAIAQIIDLAIIAGPTVAATGLFMRMSMQAPLDQPDGFLDVVRSMWPIALAMGWALMGSLAFTFSEGRWGLTPGKWLAKIRVLGTDLQPCGFWRALIRNLLKCVDGFFNFIVGIMVVALSENWQRVGDMAARTVVVRLRSDA